MPIKFLCTTRTNHFRAQALDCVLQTFKDADNLATIATESGYAMTLDTLPEGCHARTLPEERKIVLNSKDNPAQNLVAFLHECVHVKQFRDNPAQSFKSFGAFDIATELKCKRAMEADAEAQTADILLRASDNPSHRDPFKEALAEHKKSNPALYQGVDPKSPSKETLFHNWYKNFDQVRYYDDLLLTKAFDAVEETQGQRFTPFCFSRSSEELVQQICKTPDSKTPYVKDLNCLDKPAYCGITRGARFACKLFFQDFQYQTGRKPDESWKTLPDLPDPILMRSALKANLQKTA